MFWRDPLYPSSWWKMPANPFYFPCLAYSSVMKIGRAAGYSEIEFAKQHCHISEDSNVLFVTAVRTLDLMYH
jgi:hypothetical protein